MTEKLQNASFSGAVGGVIGATLTFTKIARASIEFRESLLSVKYWVTNWDKLRVLLIGVFGVSEDCLYFTGREYRPGDIAQVRVSVPSMTDLDNLRAMVEGSSEIGVGELELCLGYMADKGLIPGGLYNIHF